jgi:hypothetical protein
MKSKLTISFLFISLILFTSCNQCLECTFDSTAFGDPLTYERDFCGRSKEAKRWEKNLRETVSGYGAQNIQCKKVRKK